MVEVNPQCDVPPRPSLLSIDAGELWDLVGDDLYRRLEENDARVTDWGLEMEGMLRELCGPA